MEERLVKHAHRHPPRCIERLRPAPLAAPLPGMLAEPFVAYFTVGCPCGERAVYLLGYHARDDGPQAEDVFVGPLGIECPACGRVSELFDNKQHGYGGEHGCDCNITGEGPRARFPCPGCGEATAVLMPGFSYQGDEFDPKARRGRPQDFFGAFWLYGSCTGCGGLLSVGGWECA